MLIMCYRVISYSKKEAKKPRRESPPCCSHTCPRFRGSRVTAPAAPALSKSITGSLPLSRLAPCVAK
ncbi:hypothetical protein E2C01_099286 [Portunus trituberculatus]|uniref:Uncharacterized protein n=1 Tax=Portunus trituberculatus TaxID=210409 RepID=A0A5B7K542_PORTR|nr:hypothetical protein [Portunus trituberculatus]